MESILSQPDEEMYCPLCAAEAATDEPTFVDPATGSHYGDQREYDETGTCGSYLCCQS